MLASPPPSRSESPPVVDTYHGVDVTDPYRWLESGDSDEVRTWTTAQNRYAHRHLSALPALSAVRARAREVLGSSTVRYAQVTLAAGRLFALKSEPPRQHPFLVGMAGTRPDTERIIFDPNTSDQTVSIDWFVPSPDARLVAISLSRGGSETGDVHVFDVATGKPTGETIPRVNGGTAGGDLAWAPDGSGFYYTRYPRGEERAPEDMAFYMQVYWHPLDGPGDEDRYELGKDFVRIAEIQLDMHQPSGRLLATVQKGDGGQFQMHLREPDGRWRQFSDFGDKLIEARFGPSDDLFVVSRQAAPRGKILRVPIDTLRTADAPVFVPEGEDSIVSDFWDGHTVVPTGTHLFLVYQRGGPSEIRAFDLDGKPAAAPEQLPVSTVGGLIRADGDAIIFANTSFVAPVRWARFDPAAGITRRLALSTTSAVDFSDVEVVREEARSKDGTAVPMNILIPGGTARDGKSPCVVYGYGGFNVSLTPRFDARRRIPLDQGVVFVVANLRGGGELGEEWHEEGRLLNKQNVFDDFSAVLEHLVERGYCARERVGILGGSNGGLLMGATMVQHPEKAAAVVSMVGIYDMLRVELSPNGAFNVTEFGSVREPATFRALHAYSPYHHVVADGVAYPPTLFMTGANDPRVDPMQSRKMCARLQATARSGGGPFLLRTSADTGHGGSTALDHHIEEVATIYAFFFHHLQVRYADRP